MIDTKNLSGLAAAACIALASIQPATAQPEPAEIPPASFEGTTYVDSRGCVFLRVTIGTRTDWAPRLGPDREPVCGLEPSIAAAAPEPSPTAPTEIRTASAAPRAAAPRPARQAAQVQRASGQVLVILPPTVSIDGAVPTECPEVSGAAAAYMARPGVRCAMIPPEDLNAHATRPVERIGLDLPDPPRGYRPAWDDERINPNAGVRTVEGEVRMNEIWTDTVPRRLRSEE
jgi:hypothetical protein